VQKGLPLVEFLESAFKGTDPEEIVFFDRKFQHRVCRTPYRVYGFRFRLSGLESYFCHVLVV
jgi:hypothetical protein